MLSANAVPGFAATDLQPKSTIVTGSLRNLCGLCLLAAAAAIVCCVLLCAAALSAGGAFRT